MYRPLWIEVDRKALKKNVLTIKKIIGPKVGIMATVKQNAYGHGLVPIARCLSSLGVVYFGVGSLEEAIQLRHAGIKEPILILTALLKEGIPELFRYHVTPTVTNLDFAKSVNEYAIRKNKIHPIHLKIDTGMGRIGWWYQGAVAAIVQLKKLTHLELEGIFTHYPAAGTDDRFTRLQIGRFNELLDELSQRKIDFRYIHTANSMALWKYRHARFNLVRPGLILYGIKPDEKMDIPLSPILSLKSQVVFLKKVPRGRSIGYGRTFVTKSPTQIATVAIGYADGYPWRLSNKGQVLIRRRLCPIRGRVCMDHIMVETGNITGVHLGCPVTLIGKNSSHRIGAEDIAHWAGTIPYEIVTRLSSKIPRIYT
ncbi:MAG: alanine racemase [Candidatus Omnitrophica bacterium]|nr:alanine racemase [Candidatus Omnitrophota bacterium]